MRKKFTLLLALVLCAFSSSVMAQTYYKVGARTATLEVGKKYFISAATYYNNGRPNLLYNNSGTLTYSNQAPTTGFEVVDGNAYLFSVVKKDGNVYYIQNNEGKYLQSDNKVPTETETGMNIVLYSTVKNDVACGSDVQACDEQGNQIAYDNITDQTPIVCVYKDNSTGWRHINGLEIGKSTPFAFYEAIAETATNIIESEKVYRIYNKANAGKVIAENTTNFKLHVPAKADDDKSQLWYVEGDDVGGYSFRNLKTGDYMNFFDEMYTNWNTVDSPVKFYLTKIEEATGENPDYFAIALRNNAQKEDLAYAHYSNGNVVRWRAADKENENYTSVNASLWQFETVSIEVLATLDASYTEWKEGFEELKTEANTLLTTTAGFSVAPFTLTTTNTTCPAAISDNSDGGGVPALLDDNDETFMHTKYSGKGNVGEPHYIQVDLGEGQTAKYITFSYRARHNNQNNNPEKIIVKGSVDGEAYTDIQTLAGLPDGLVEYESSIIGNGTAYRYFRFVVTETTNNANHEGYVFFSLGKFRMNVVAVVNDAYAGKLTVLDIMNEWLKEHSVSETRSDDWCLVNAYTRYNSELSELIYGATLREYPFTLTTDVNAPVCYQILSGRGNANTSYYFTLKPNDGGKVKLETSTQDNIYSYWFFMEEPETGKLIVVPFMDVANPLGYITVADGDSKLTNVHTTANFAGYHYEVIEYGGVNGFPYALKPYKANTNVSNHGGASNFMGFYNGNNDGGTAVKFDAVACPALEFRNLPSVIATANEGCPGDDRVGTELNKYSTESVNAYKAAVTEAGQLYNAVSATTSDALNAKINTLQNLYYDVLKLNQPEKGQFYRIRCAANNKRLLSTLVAKSETENRLGLANTVTDESIFLYTTEGALVSYQTGLYIGHRTYNAVGTPSTVTFTNAYNKTLGEYNIKVGDNWIYGDGNYLDSGSGAHPDQRRGYNWWLESENITSLPVTVSAVGYATFIAPVALEIPDSVKAYTGNVNGEWLTLAEIEGGVIPANTGVVLESQFKEGEKKFAKNFSFTIVADEVEDIDSDLEGSTAAKDNEYKGKTDGNIPYYTLQSDGNGGVVFKQFNGDNLAGSKAYLVLPADENGKVAQSIGIRFEGSTDIEHSTLNPQPSTQIYDLLGRRVESMTKGGIYIVNGKKVIK